MTIRLLLQMSCIYVDAHIYIYIYVFFSIVKYISLSRASISIYGV